jgi:hypothetical protein
MLSSCLLRSFKFGYRFLQSALGLGCAYDLRVAAECERVFKRIPKLAAEFLWRVREQRRQLFCELLNLAVVHDFLFCACMYIAIALRMSSLTGTPESPDCLASHSFCSTVVVNVIHWSSPLLLLLALPIESLHAHHPTNLYKGCQGLLMVQILAALVTA